MYARCIFLLSFHFASHLCWLGIPIQYYSVPLPVGVEWRRFLYWLHWGRGETSRCNNLFRWLVGQQNRIFFFFSKSKTVSQTNPRLPLKKYGWRIVAFFLLSFFSTSGSIASLVCKLLLFPLQKNPSIQAAAPTKKVPFHARDQLVEGGERETENQLHFPIRHLLNSVARK